MRPASFFVRCAGALALSLLVGSAARAQAPREAVFHLDLADPEASVPTPEEANKQPLGMGYFLMDLADAADDAVERGDHAAALKFYRAMAKAVPDRAISYFKQCDQYQALNERYKAIDACWEGLARGGLTLSDYQRFVRLVLSGDGALSADYVQRLDDVLAQLGEQSKSDASLELPTAELACEVASKLQDEKRLRACTSVLKQHAPTDPRTLTFEWTLAMLRHDRDAAEGVIARAKQSKAPPALVGRMATGLERLEGPRLGRVLLTKAAPVGGALLLLGGLAWAFHRKRHERLA